MSAINTLPVVLRKDLYFAETGYYPFPSQAQIHYDATRNRALSNGRRWGKTLLGGKDAEVTAFVKNKLSEAQRGWIVGPNYSDCEKEFRVVFDSLKKLGVDTVSRKFLRNVDSGNMQIATNWGWHLECRSAAHPESLVGEGLDFVLLVEAGRLLRKTFTEYIRPALSDKRGWSLMTGVPEIATDSSLLYWGYKRGQNSARQTWNSWQMPSWTNTVVFPGGRTDPEILEAEEDLTEDEFNRQYGGQFVDRVGRVMQEWDDDIHWKDLRYNPEWPLYGAVDYGYKNLFVFLWIQVDRFGTVYVIDEICKTLVDAEDMAKYYIRNHYLFPKLVAFYPDPAEPDDTNILVKHLGVGARPNTGGELKTRINLIRSALKSGPADVLPKNRKPRLLINKTCTTLRWEMNEGYRWPEHKSETKGLDEHPMDKDNHCVEALGRFFKGYFSIVGEVKRRSRQRRAKFGKKGGTR